VLDDLLGMSTAFGADSRDFSALMPVNGPATPDCGDADLNTVMSVATEMAGQLHALIAQRIEQHAAKLRAAHDIYERAETDLQALCRGLTNGA
jgi:hypothetical protein